MSHKINSTVNNPVLYSNASWKEIQSTPPDEIEVTLFVNGQEWLTFLCSPFQEKYLGVGFLKNEGFIKSASEIEFIYQCANKSTLDIWLTHTIEKPSTWKRASGCNGSETLASNDFTEKLIFHQFTPETILKAINLIFTSQSQYKKTRGIHCSILFDGSKKHIITEDIGRHNTIDKLSGLLLLDGDHFKRKILATTGRISSEMLSKAANLGAEIVISHTSPTTKAVQAANEKRITLIGYARESKFIIYTHSERINS